MICTWLGELRRKLEFQLELSTYHEGVGWLNVNLCLGPGLHDQGNLGTVDSALGLGLTTPFKADSGPGRGILRSRHQFPC